METLNKGYKAISEPLEDSAVATERDHLQRCETQAIGVPDANVCNLWSNRLSLRFSPRDVTRLTFGISQRRASFNAAIHSSLESLQERGSLTWGQISTTEMCSCRQSQALIIPWIHNVQKTLKLELGAALEVDGVLLTLALGCAAHLGKLKHIAEARVGPLLKSISRDVV